MSNASTNTSYLERLLLDDLLLLRLLLNDREADLLFLAGLREDEE
jgi:hypothetical protein